MAQVSLNKTFNNVLTIKDVSSVTTLKNTDSGQIIHLDGSAGFVLTLPAAEAGLNYKIVLKADVQNDASMKITVTAGDAFFGAINLVSTTADKRDTQTISYATGTGTPGSYDFLTLDSDAATSGGLAGDVLDIIAVDGIGWLVNGTLSTTHAAPEAPVVITSA